MKFNLLNPKQSLTLALRRQRPKRDDLNLFREQITLLLENASEHETEENQKTYIRDFLLNTYYKGNYEINTKGTEDLVIHLGKTRDEKVGVIIEAKRPGNKSEMPSAQKPNCKALQELVLYYMRERVNENNIDLKYLVITNVYEWYIIEAAWFEKTFYRHAKFRKEFEEWSEGKKVTPDTNLFYKDIAKPFIDSLEEDVDCAYFNIKNYEDALSNPDDKSIIALFKLLSPNHLLKTRFEDDSNKLDEKFYKELLHIIGLEEAKEGSKFIIRRKKENRNTGSLLENALNELQTEGIDKVPDRSQYGSDKDEQLYNIALELCITWINRILFLKLLEGQLRNYHNGDADYLFLNSKFITDYGELFKLFHKVLAVDIPKRDAALAKKYSRVPYLNSSLFEISPLEDVTIKINTLDQHAPLEFISSTILKVDAKKTDELPALDYLFKFLNAYDFASESTEDIEENNKTLINASVLGKVFEKINGYKDGSVYTPGFITMYMCRQSIRQAVMQKFKEKYNWNVDEFTDLINYIADHRKSKEILEFNELINSLHICDPAVGSGHFLVSALNELIAIKSELRILADKEGVRLDCNVHIENDELFVVTDDGKEENFMEYKVSVNGIHKNIQRIQKTLFHEKQNIIENCLFGVDINPNSVKICRLRLWIELLKNAYYKEESNYTDLETLPNIDINIKCGNSLISRFPLDSDLKKALKSIKYNIETYKGYVNEYKNAKDREYKKGLEKLIDEIKNNFRTRIGDNDPKVMRLQKLQYEFNLLVAPNMFREDDEPNYGNKNYKQERKEKIKELEEDINKLSKEIEQIKNNVIYRNALEWRFEFPEVLNNNGDFEGFDVVIGNPPYIRQEEVKQFSGFLKSLYTSFSGKADLYVFFYELGVNILKHNGYLSFITSGKFLEANYGKPLIKFIISELELSSIINFHDLQVFEGVTTYPVICNGIKNKEKNSSFRYYDVKQILKNSLDEILFSLKPLVTSKNIFTQNDYKFVENNVTSLIEKVKQNSISLKKFCGLPIVGIKTGYNKGYLTNIEANRYIKNYAFGRDIKRYQPIRTTHNIIFPYNSDFTIAEIKNEKVIFSELLKNQEPLSKRAIIHEGLKNNTKCWFEYQQVNKTVNYSEEYIVYPNVSLGNNFTLSKNNVIDMTAFIIKSNSRFLLAILNSKLIAYLLNLWSIRRRGGYLEYKVQYLEKIPIKNITLKAQQPFIILVDKILAAKKAGKDTTALEAEIDQMVYELYGLTEDEIKIIENNE